MFNNYIKIAWRNLMKDKQFTLLNTIGLSAGIACTLLIYLWVADEMSVDRIFDKDDQIYQLMELGISGGDKVPSDESSGLLNEVVKARSPEVIYATAVAPSDWFQKFTLSAGEKNIKAAGQYAGKDYFNIFSFPLVEGKRNDLLTDKNSIVISDELANKLFGTTQGLKGKAIRFQQQRDFFVSGVFEKPDSHSSQQFDFVLSFDYLNDEQGWLKNWGNTGPHNFVMVKKGTDIQAFNKRIAGIITEAIGVDTRTPFAMRFSENYLKNTFSHGSRIGGKSEYVKLFSLIAIFILAIACINFMNLSTAKSSRRMKEVGIKKVVGASRQQLISQFLSESMLITVLSMMLALVLAWIMIPQFNQLTGKTGSLNFSWRLLLALAGIALFTGLLSGSYPALYLSKFNPIVVLKGKLISTVGEVLSRKGLVVFQFALSVILIVSVMIIYQQVKFIQSEDPGYNKDNIVKFDTDGKLQGNQENFIAQLKKIPGVVNASFTFNNMIGRNFGTNGVNWEGKDQNDKIYFEGFGGGYDFTETMGMKIKEGRYFSKAFGDESNNVLVNESAVSVMHIKDPVGKNIQVNGRNRRIVGVVKNFHFESLHETVKPAYFMLITQEKNPWYKIMARIRPGQQKETLDRIQQLYESYNPGFPFVYDFLDEAYQKQYEAEVRVASLSKYFSGLAILISCLGLFGLAAFTAQKRQKEIGIRKVVGASVNTIILMLSKDFLKLVLIALVVAFPISWWLLDKWLQSFAYRISISPWIFLGSGALVILITMLTISFQSVKAALSNPVRSLRSE